MILHARASLLGGDHDEAIDTINRIPDSIDWRLENLIEENRIFIRTKVRDDLIEFVEAALSYKNNEDPKFKENKVDDVIKALKVALSKLR